MAIISLKKVVSTLTAITIACGTLFVTGTNNFKSNDVLTSSAVLSGTSIADLPSDYQEAADWIWTNRVVAEDSVSAYNTIFDQIVDGKGTLKYIVKWSSTETLTLATRQNLQKVLENSINEWTDWLVGYDEWPYKHINVEIVGWAVYDTSYLQDLQPDEKVYTTVTSADYTWIPESMRAGTLPTTMPIADETYWRYTHYTDKSYTYGGSYDNRFDMYLECVDGMINMGGFGGRDAQVFSDESVISLANGDQTTYHIFMHEMGHAFGLTDFYGENGATDGPPPNGFPDDGTSIMMAGSSTTITNFDGWFFRYLWTKLKSESGRFDLANAVSSTESSTEASTEAPTVAPTEAETTEATTEAESVDQTRTWTFDVPANCHKVKITVNGTPYAALTGTYNYTDSLTNQTTNSDFYFPNSLGETGTDSFEIEIPTNQSVNQISVTSTWYAAWDNDSAAMKDISVSGLDITAEYTIDETESTTVEPTEAPTEAVATVTEPTEASTTPVSIKGDVNADGVFNIADIVMMKKWILKSGNMTDWTMGDFDGNNKINAIDLAMMKDALN